MNPVYEGTARPACTAVPREVQRRALREALALTADLGWINRQGVSKNVYKPRAGMRIPPAPDCAHA